MPQSWWHNDDVERYKKHLSQAIEEGLHSMVEMLQSKSKEVDADALFRDWAKIKESFLSGADA